MIGNTNYETNFPHKILLTNMQAANLRKTFASYLSTDIMLPKTQLSKWYNQEDFLVNFLVNY